MNINTIFRRTDKEIASAVRQALDRDVSVPNTRIRITVSDGWVTLEGQVRTYSQRDDVVRA
ncbi:MAG: BON domain-containing protein, partial [Acidobacteria bacterium]|nr:BON domain-containing protein [Acidobacteriota bacterium]